MVKKRNPPVEVGSLDLAGLADTLRAAGLRPVQFWVPDTRSPEFAAQVRQQCRSLKGDPAEAEVLRFTEDAASHVEGWE